MQVAPPPEVVAAAAVESELDSIGKPPRHPRRPARRAAPRAADGARGAPGAHHGSGAGTSPGGSAADTWEG